MANKDVEKLLEDFFSTKQIDPLSQSLLQDIKSSVEAQVQVANRQNLEAKEIKKIFEAFRALLKSEGLTSTKFSGKLTQVQNTLAKSSDTINLDKLEKLLSHLTSSSVLQSQMAANRGDKNGIFSAASMNSEVFKQVINDLMKNQKINSLNNMNALQRWWVGWANGYTNNEDKKKKGLVKELIDGLAANKFVGGALKDTTRLVGLMLGSWIKSKVGGPLGGVLAGGAYVLTEIVATVVPMVLGMMAHGAIQGLMQGWVMGAVGSKATGSMAQLGATALMGTSAAGSVKTLRVTGGQDTLKQALANKKVGVTFNGQHFTKSPSGLLLPSSSVSNPKSIPSGTKLVRSLSRTANASSQVATAVTKNTSALGKLGGNLLKFGGNLTKFMGTAAVGIGSVFNAFDAFKSFKKGDTLGGGLKSVSAITGMASLFAGPAAIPLLITSIITGLIAAIRDAIKGKETERITASNLFSNSKSYWNTPQHSYSDSPYYGNSQGGRDYVRSDGLDMSQVINLKSARTSQKGINFIKNQEGGFRAKAYPDVNGYAAGYGSHRIDGKPVRKGQVVTRAQAERAFNSFLASGEKFLRQNIKVPISQGMFDTLMDMYYNGGPGMTLGTIKLLNQGKYDAARANVLKFKYDANGKYLPRLAQRSQERVRDLWEKPGKPKAIPRANSQQTVTIQTPNVSSTPAEVKAPEEQVKEEMKTESTPTNLLDLTKPSVSTTSQSQPENKPSEADLTSSIINAVSKNIDVPGNDTTFGVLIKCNNFSMFGG